MTDITGHETMPKEQQDPKPGEVWRLKEASDDPFGRKPVDVHIREVRSGWVRYRMNEIFDDERKSIVDFVVIYERQESAD